MNNIITNSASDFYSLLEQTLNPDATTAARYDILRNVFKRVIDQAIADCPISIVGIFAKLDYSIKERHLKHDTSDLLQQARKDLFPGRSQSATPTEEYLAESFPHNLKATTLLVHHLCERNTIPAQLKKSFPLTDKTRTWGKFEKSVTHAVVARWTQNYIWATEEEHNTLLKISYGKENTILTRDGKGDWSYLNTILWKGAQLNLVRMRKDKEKEVWLPELIILEPDYLINITTIASCFETYADSPYVNLINKLKPQANTIPIHLGNLAGQILDDTIHGKERSIDQSINAFIRSHTLSMVACTEMNERSAFEKFRRDAAIQKRNIEKLIGEDLPKVVSEYDKRDVMLEPSFFSETLGIQGRMDFMYEHDGNAVIIEQKSGKGEFVTFTDPQYDPNIPEAKLPHYIQVLLYGALFQYELNRDYRQLKHLMLLYSKYTQGLLKMPQSPQLFLSAIRMRNLIAWTEMQYAQEGMEILRTITPEKLNRKGSSGKLWERYTRPQLAGILDPIHQATPLEQAYFLRFMRFIEKESLLSRIGTRTKENSGFASIWHDTLDEKKAAGNIYDHLSIASFGSDATGINSVTLAFGDDVSTESTNFRIGDIVILYPYKEGSTPDACAQMVHRANIEDIREDRLVLRLRNSQTDPMVFDRHKGELWAIEHDLTDASSSTLYSAMHSFLTATQSRRDLILSQREPRVDTSRMILGEYGHHNTLVRRAKQAQDIFLIIGPPGTGKTSFGLVNLLKEELLEPNTNILLLSYTNRAVDEICSKLVEMKAEDPSFDFIRIGSYLSCSAEYRPYMLNGRLGDADKPGSQMLSIIRKTRVFCGTTSALNGNTNLFSLKHFDLAIIDEASQILEPHLIGLLSAHQGDREAIDRFVLIGDHKQLPAVVQQSEEESAVTEDMLRDIHLTNCRNSLFERMLHTFKKADGEYDERLVYMLTKQGRMHKDIAEFPNIAFYGGQLDVVPLPHQLLPTTPIDTDNSIIQLLTSHRIAFVESECPLSSPSAKTNQTEAEMIAAFVYQAYQLTLMRGEKFDKDKTIGVIVPYRNQISTVRNAIDRYGQPLLHDIAIDTVERYQGSQRDFIIYGFTIQQPYQLNFLSSNTFEEDELTIDRKLNVAMTRARLNLVMIGNPALLQHNPVFKQLMDFTRAKGSYFSKL